MSVSLSVCLSLTPPKQLNLMDDFPWDADGFRLKHFRIQPTLCLKTHNALKSSNVDFNIANYLYNIVKNMNNFLK